MGRTIAGLDLGLARVLDLFRRARADLLGAEGLGVGPQGFP